MDVSTAGVAPTVVPSAGSLAVMSVRPSALQFDWGTDGWVLWIDDLTADSAVLQQLDVVMERIGFAIELQTGWDHRTDGDTYHPLFGYRLLLRDATGLWHAVRVDEGGRYVDTLPLEELDFEIAYDKVMWLE